MAAFPASIDERIRFFRNEAPRSLIEFLIHQAGLSRDRSLELLGRGGIYVNQKREQRADRALSESDIVRVHFYPRRFDLKTNPPRILHQFTDFIIVMKPRGVPVHSTVDNTEENAVAYFERELGRKLFVTHRLDMGTRGILVVGLTAHFQKTFNRLLAEKQVTKKYRALVEKPLGTGTYVHWMQDTPRAPKTLALEEQSGWQRCELRVESCTGRGSLFEIEIALITGRTHQIRAQLSFMGAPIVGDKFYGSSKCLGDPWQGASDNFALDCFEMGFLNERFRFDSTIGWEENWFHENTPP